MVLSQNFQKYFWPKRNLRWQRLPNPLDPVPFAIAGRLESKRQQFKIAIDNYHGLGLILEQQGKPVEAAQEYQLALKEDPDYAEAQANLIQVNKILQFRPAQKS
jgi:tetratricopeptide (TPR) repeat protein